VNTRRAILVTFVAVIIVTGYSVMRAQQLTLLSVWDGVYTEEQAQRGEPLYKDHCFDCHGEDLEGDAEAPPLAGGTFLTNWDGLTLGNLYLRIRRDMPLNKDAGKLSPSVNADVLAYILSVNHFPSGHAELPHAAEILNQIRFEAEKDDRKR
jgi:mono/diheme cytochrome c family protein